MHKVLIATPTYNAQVYAAFSHSLRKTVQNGAGFDIRDYYPVGKTHCSARNDCVAQALNNGFDDLVFIDADQDWEPGWVSQLLNYPVDVVGAPVRKKSDTPERYNVYVPRGPETLTENRLTGLWTAPGMTVGTGFLRLSRKALQRLWGASEPYQEPDGTDCRWIFDIHPMGGELVSEDVVAGHKLMECGFVTWLAPHMNIGHHDGMKRYVGNFVDFTRRLIAERAA
jgi:hypothetical protein